MTPVRWLALALALAACTTQSPPAAPVPPAGSGSAMAAFTPTTFDRLAGWAEDNVAASIAPFRAGCAAMAGRATLGGQAEAARRGGAPVDWRPACEAAARVPTGDDAAARAFFETWLEPFTITDAGTGSATGLFTGYYEPEMRGAVARSPAYATPLLTLPADLVSADLGAFAPDLKGRTLVGRVADGRLVPYFDRAAITDGALAGRRLELLWLADPVDAFFLEIQGSGRVRLRDGRVVRVTYAGQNGRPYLAIGRVLIERGALRREDVSLQSIRAWLAAHPAEARGVMDQNPSYVFFRILAGTSPDQGPPGALGAALTPGRSLAVDRSVVPLGSPVWLDTTDPLDAGHVRRLMLAQDTGGAIKGAVRGDVFWGWGADAEARAGTMRAQGTATILLPRPAAGVTAAR